MPDSAGAVFGNRVNNNGMHRVNTYGWLGGLLSGDLTQVRTGLNGGQQITSCRE